MSTRANIIIKDNHTKLFFYRHSDGYPEVTGKSLSTFVNGYETKQYRDNPNQSAGWLILQGHEEMKKSNARIAKQFKDDTLDIMYGWKVGFYEPTDAIHCDIDFLYIIDLTKKSIECRQTKSGFFDNPTEENTKLISTTYFKSDKEF